jgi:hypothetical protein
MKSEEIISRQETHAVKWALAWAMLQVGQVDGYSWLSSRRGGPAPDLALVCGGSGWFGAPPGAPCDICAAPATVRQGDLALCDRCYEGVEGPTP